ncbi:conserved hypothetical protein, partial [Ricinus communis]
VCVSVAVALLPAALVVVTLANTVLSESAAKSAPGTSIENLPPACTVPVKSLLLTVTVTTSPTLKSPLTVPVTGIAAAVDSAAFTMPSPATFASRLIANAGGNKLTV